MEKSTEALPGDRQFALMFKDIVFPLLSERLSVMETTIGEKINDIKGDIKDLRTSVQDIKDDFNDIKITQKADHDILKGPSGLEAKYDVMWTDVTELKYIKRHAWAIITIGATMLATAVGWGVSIYTSDKFKDSAHPGSISVKASDLYTNANTYHVSNK